jgi:hypothetical protein
MAGELGLAAVLPQRGWEALKAIGWSVQKPRPRHFPRQYRNFRVWVGRLILFRP